MASGIILCVSTPLSRLSHSISFKLKISGRVTSTASYIMIEYDPPVTILPMVSTGSPNRCVMECLSVSEAREEIDLIFSSQMLSFLHLAIPLTFPIQRQSISGDLPSYLPP